ncbi:restriction endonuclease subunit S [Paeniclostridium sordellii]|uniref:restriction endonuclease subunit S n=1 Tax=Paraclostridium sordellii TaxID=1505 RepID=UPI0005E8ACE8|nr:restriction endonuclease subunit S [Paeniclostridium sordellii]MDU4412811.1 restriction endonuclease subunit S [Paeniclostridium sordellii]MRZ29586.1 restriction endonuclease subunit S [Paeniclostridium sordellii]MVO73648.1 restriction endonuclease subunit S [Paeniclostridium sordellii]CEQ06457.1 restriction modification system DNA specificity domain [[Clostridium] sordellii] [Paeniclostridium sordellii]
MKVRLDEVCNIYKGKTTITKAIQGEYPLVVTAENRASHNEYQFDCRAVCVPLVSATGHGHASIKRLHYQEGKFALGTILSAVIPKDETILDTRYLYIYLSYFKDSVLVPLMRGSANVSLTIKSLGSAEIELPPIEKQRSIVELVTKIEKNKSEVDNKLEEQTKIISLLRNEILNLAVKGKLVPQDESDEPASVLLERIREEKDRLVKEKKIKKEKLLQEISEDELPYELPKGWEWVRLNDISSYIQRGKSPKYCENSNIPVISQKCVQWNGFDISKARFIEVDSLEKYGEDRYVKPNDLLWNSTGRGTLGRINVYPDNIEFDIVVADSHVTIIRPIEISSKYLYSWFAGPMVQDEIDDKSIGSTKQTELSTVTVKSYLVPIPPLNEQTRIVEKVDKLMKVCDELELRIQKSKKYSEKLMQSILKNNFKA